MSEELEVKKSFGDLLQSLNRSVLYLILFVVVSVPLVVSKYVDRPLPVKPEDYTKDTYTILRNLGPEDTIILDSGFTNSSRGENGGQLEAVLRMMIRQRVKFILYSSVDPQSPQIARDFIRRINKEFPEDQQYRKWNDYIDMGFFSDSPTMLQAMGQDLKRAWQNRTTRDLDGKSKDIFMSPPMKNINKIEDIKAYVTIAASSIMPTIVPRVGKKVRVLSMITGVMFPEQLNYYRSGQLKGLVNGLGGCVELETLMEKGIDAGGNVVDKEAEREMPMKADPSEKGENQKNYNRGMAYYLALHAALALLIIAVIVGNIGMFLARRSQG